MKKPLDNKRSKEWPKFKRDYAKKVPKICSVCGAKNKVELHHIEPFHINQAKELDETNVIWLCESEKFVNCHLLYGHLGNFKSWNEKVREDAKEWKSKIEKRP